LIKNADHVISSSPTLNEYCISLNKKSAGTFISSSIDTNRFLPNNKYQNDHKIVVGWTGTFSSIPFLESIKDVLVELSKVCDFKLRVISNCDFEASELDVELISWTKKREVEDLQGIDIGLYPLEDSEWVLGKSGLKALQYMSFGIPTVATSVGTSKIIIQNNINGFLVKSKSDWIDTLKKLIEDAELRKRLGEEARKTIVDKYSKKVTKNIYLQVLNNLIE
jgi:glycosyltransferase involved in cell wall biosynthesis